MGEGEAGRVSADNWVNSWCGNGGDGAASRLTMETVFIEESSLGGKGAEMKHSGQRRCQISPKKARAIPGMGRV